MDNPKKLTPNELRNYFQHNKILYGGLPVSYNYTTDTLLAEEGSFFQISQFINPLYYEDGSLDVEVHNADSHTILCFEKKPPPTKDNDETQPTNLEAWVLKLSQQTVKLQSDIVELKATYEILNNEDSIP